MAMSVLTWMDSWVLCVYQVNFFGALAPVAYVDHEKSLLLRILADLDAVVLFELLGVRDFLPDASLLQKLAPGLCSLIPWGTSRSGGARCRSAFVIGVVCHCGVDLPSSRLRGFPVLDRGSFAQLERNAHPRVCV